MATEESQKIKVKVCSLRDNLWRDIDSFPVVPFAASYGPQEVYFNGTLNWLALCDKTSNNFEWNDTITIDQMVIVSLDLGKETYTPLLLPRCLNEAPQAEPTIGILMDCLCFYHDYMGTHFVVWQMKEFGVEKSWTQLMNLQIDCLGFTSPLLPLCMSGNGDILIIAADAIDGELHAIIYNRRDDTLKQTEVPEYICTMDHVESLVSPFCN